MPTTKHKSNIQTPDGGSTLRAAREVLSGRSKKSRIANLLPFLGPAFIASIAYVDPGNFATNIQGGAQFGYELLWVILGSNLMAMLLQALSAKLGIATGKNLAEHCREQYSSPVVWSMWVLMELVAMATDLAEFLGAAVALNLLFGFPLWLAGLLTAVVTFLILGLERYGFRALEAVITGFLVIIAVSYLIELFLGRPDWAAIAYNSVVPHFTNKESVLLATGILGATVMPHAIFLHSALTQGRVVVKKAEQLRRLFRFEIIDVAIAMLIASSVNAAMLITAAATFFGKGLNVGTLEEAYQTLQPLLGPAAGTVFGVALLASGLSSSSVGTMAGQVIMQGFLHFHVPPWIRRVVTILPSLIVIFIGFDPTRTLVLSQVVLSFGLPFAIIPLVMFTSRKDIMGVLVNKRLTTWLASLCAVLIIALNFFLLYQIFFGS
ncbi:MAG: divalent metal cation transporter [Chloroflexi bacterium GWB2_49_20]|nr:MAG: divalent metal cation transporter [Chloroflexi bacterium GWB2_49_20]OGN79574.1 MAG: divalent metal cation transporter [Chloroflexi bacterium GWC2_49_37]OGN84503.1 MAG: divalent metal cation transporter [Chloroflexi bacterium GWD2_49_16]HBG74074.1 divalent metal cation transporter [Anaerolineae bacterium]HCC78876.1 divalent metal cation transporter [Anaerolineae bacterium]